MKFKKTLAFLLLAVMLFTPISFAAIVVQEDGTQEGIVEKINISTNLDVSVSGKTATVTTSTTQAIPVNSTFVGLSQQYTTPVTGQYFQLYVYDAQFSPASGAPAGSVKLIRNAANSGSCHNTAGGTTFVVCVSDGTNWKSIS